MTTIAELEAQRQKLANIGMPSDVRNQAYAKIDEGIAKLKDAASQSKGYVNEASEKGAQRGEQLYGMDASETGKKTQGVIKGYEDRLNNVSQSKNRANTLKRQARANKGSALSAGESNQMDRNAAFDVSSESRRNLGDYRTLLGNIAANQGSLEMGFGNIGVAGQAPVVPQQAGISVVCTELKRQGILPKSTWKADEEYGKSLDPVIYYGYYVWARHLAKAMSKSKLLTKLIAPIAVSWAYHISGEKNIAGCVINKVGLIVCKFIGKLTYNREDIHGWR